TDLPENPAVISQTTTYSGLTMDNPDDVDWYRFRLSEAATLILSSASDLDGLGLKLFRLSNPADTGSGALAQIVRDATDVDDLRAHDTILSAYDLSDIKNYGKLAGLTLHKRDNGTTDVDVFRLVLDGTGTAND